MEAYCSITETNALDVSELELDAVTFASSVTVERFIQQVGSEGLAFLKQSACQFIAIGERTAQTMRELAVPVSAVAGESTLPGLVDACKHALCSPDE